MSSNLSKTLHNAPRARPAGRSARISRDVMQATLEILSEEGAGDLSFEKVAVRAKVNRATLYRRWENKARLLSWVLMAYMEENAPTPDTGSLEDDLVAMMLSLDEVMNSPMATAFFQVMSVDAGRDDTVADAVKTFWRRRFELADGMVEKAIERSELPADVDRQFLLDQVFGPFFYRLIRRAPPVTPQLAHRLVAHALSGYPPGSASDSE
jgi:AcrR family transcriptional regulator